MSSAGLKKSLDFIAKRVNERKVSSKTGEQKQDSQARSDLEKHNGQIWIINEFQQAAIIEKRFGIRLTDQERKNLFILLDTFYKGKEARIKFNTVADRKAANRAKEQAKEESGDYAYLVTNFEQAKTLKYKSANPIDGDASQIQANYINNLPRIKRKIDKGQINKVDAKALSEQTQIGHGDRGNAASAFALDRAIVEAETKYNLSKAEVKRLRNIATRKRTKYDVKANLRHSQYLDSKGRFKKNYFVVLSSQYYGDNKADAIREKAALEETLEEYDKIVEEESSTKLRDAVTEITLEAFSGKPSKNKKVTGKRRKTIKENSNAGRVDSRESVERTSYQVVKGVSAKGINAPKKEKAKVRTSFVQLQGLLNAKLPQTVAANMGAPRLENRTGTFASSVRVTEIQNTRQGFASIGYTYQKDPYAVFENTSGTRFASAERDPRSLIDLSIREIAQQMALGRFYTRRV
tara:strand:- start:19 stop:1410 length:1392 start_codon:yes stop_codon:yes gene_type:complete